MRVRFWTRIDATNAAGEAPLNCYVILNKVKCSDFSVDLMIPLDRWDSKQQKVNDSHPLAVALNQKINFIKVRLMQIEMPLSLQGEVTAQKIKEIFFKEYKIKRPEPKPVKEPAVVKYLFADQMNNYLNKVRIPLGISINTKKNDTTFIHNIEKFPEMSGQEDYEVGDVDVAFTNEFTIHVKTLNPTTSYYHINRHIAYMRSVLDYCVDKKQIKYNPLAGKKLSCNYKENPESFELEDIDKLKAISSHFMTIEQNQVRDIFLFMIGSGIDHCDYEQRKDHWIYRENNRFWMKYVRQKTINYKNADGYTADSILLPDAVEILLKYGGSLSCLPDCGLNDMNELIKEVYALANIRRHDLEKISTKLARKTYANLQTNYVGLTDESVAYLMGHTTTKHLRKYRRYKKKKVLNELNNLK